MQFMLEKVQHRFARMIPGLKSLEYEKRSIILDIWSLGERINRAYILEVYRMKVVFLLYHSRHVFFQIENQHRTRGHSWKIVNQRINLDLISTFSERVVDRWNKNEAIGAYQTDIDCDSINGFKNKLEKIRKQKIGFFMD